jgi:hypothetical protein
VIRGGSARLSRADRWGGAGQPELALDGLAGAAGAEEVVVDIGQPPVLPGQRRGDVDVVDAAAGQAVPDRDPRTPAGSSRRARPI